MACVAPLCARFNPLEKERSAEKMANQMQPEQPVTLLICALGGEGGGVLAEWLTAVARHAGYPAQATSIPGVAQRTGATTYYLEFWPSHERVLNGKRPIFGLTPLPGKLDLLISSELLETARQIGNGMAASDRTCVIASTARALTTAERTHLGDGRWDQARLTSLIQTHAARHHILDMAHLTREAGTVVSSVMLGCIAASGVLPFGRADYEVVVGEGGGATAKASLHGFSLGFDAVQHQRDQGNAVINMLAKPLSTDETQSEPALPVALASDITKVFPSEICERISLGCTRVTAYQNESYGKLYLARLQRVWAAEQAAGGARGEATHEASRWLALWMAFDDIVRVAHLKAVATRRERVHREVKADEGDLLRIYDHFKPGVPEFAGLLPPSLGKPLTRWDAARVARGQKPWERPMKIGTHTVFGMLALRLLASMKWLRPKGQRYITEQKLIDQWIDGVVQGLHAHTALGLEIARCGRLIKGYGSTNERGKHNLLHVLEHLAQSPQLPDLNARAKAVAAAREAALKDESGKSLDAALRSHGAPARPLREQPIRWMRNPRHPGAVRP